MSHYEFRLPDIGEGIAEAEIVAWHVAIGDLIEEDAPLADVMTDKATVEMTAPVTGRIVAIGGAVGDMVAIGAMLASFEVASADLPAAPNEEVGAAAAITEIADADAGILAEDPQPSQPAPDCEAPRGDAPPTAAPSIYASPAVRQRARNLGIDLARVRSETGRIRHADLDAYLLYNRGSGYGLASVTRPDEAVKVVGLRRRIAENMAASKRHIPHFTYVEEFDVTKLEALRADLNANRGDKPRVTILPLLAIGLCRALANFPMLNARFDDEAGIVTRSGAVHLGIATQTDAGLMVPVLRHAETQNLWQLAAEIARLAEAARSGNAKREELSGSTLTITSLGLLGGIATTPVINRPEVAIVGPNKIVERPVFAEGRVVAAKLMNFSISCDHRVVDGWDAARFVQAVKHLVETPALLFAP